MSLEPRLQISLLNDVQKAEARVQPFAGRLPEHQLRMGKMTTMQINLGKLCNQTCKHCHVDAGPTRKEIMTRATMQQCLNALDQYPFETVDITGGAPEMVADFRFLVEESAKRGKHVIVRCNLTIIEAHQKYADLPEFYARHKVEVVSSLPSYSDNQTDRQRGSGVFAKSIRALQKLNACGYGTDPALPLHLVYNPNGAFLPGDQQELEHDFKIRLKEDFGIVFNNLYTITNMPISRFLEYLIESGNLNGYMLKLSQKFNPASLESLMCRSMISISWEGDLFDCDFNQMLDLKIRPAMHISQFNGANLAARQIVTGQHCYGCTAGAGSSCGGSIAP